MKSFLKKSFFFTVIIPVISLMMIASAEDVVYFKAASGFHAESSEIYGEVITGVGANTTVGQLCDNAVCPYGLEIAIVDENGEPLEETDKVYSGCLFVAYTDDIYDTYCWIQAFAVIVNGDADGDGDRDMSDMELGTKMMLGLPCDDAYAAAFDKNLDGTVSLADLRGQTVGLMDEYSENPDETSPFAKDYAVVVDEYTVEAAILENGQIVRKSYLSVYIDGKIKDVPVKKITADMVSEPEWEDYLVNYDSDYGGFYFSDYVGKLAIAETDDEGYFFKLLDTAEYSDSSVLSGTDSESAYMYTCEGATLSVDDANRIVLSDTGEAGFSKLAVKDYSQIILSGYDADDEVACLRYTASEIFTIADKIELDYAVVMVQNNPGMTKMENLVVIYGETYEELPTEASYFMPIPASASFEQDENWVMVLDGQVTEYAMFENDMIVKKSCLSIVENGETKIVPVRQITQSMVEWESEWEGYIPCYDEDYYEYDFSDYVGKLAVAQKDHKGRYIFRTLEAEDYSDGDVLLYDESDIGNSEGMIFAFAAEDVALVKKTGYNYTITADGESAYSDSFAYGENSETEFRQLAVKDYTKIIIKSVDADGETVISTYDYENLPDFAHDFYFDRAIVVVGNNSITTRRENLSFFYGETDREIEIYPGDITGIVSVNSYEIAETDDGYVYYVNACDTQTGVSGTYEAFYGDEMLLEKGELLGITSKGYIMDDYSFGSILEQGDPNLDIYDIDDKVGALGWCVLAAYDTDAKIIELEGDSNCYYVDDKTVFVEYDISDAWATLRDDSILTSNAPKNNFDGTSDSFKAVYVTANELETAEDEGFFTVVSVILVHK